MNLKNKKVLLVGLGILGGGESIAKFLIGQGAKLTITDLRKKEILNPVIKRLGGRGLKTVLGRHEKIDFKNNRIIVFNPAVSIFSPWVRLAKKYKKQIENDLTIFLENIKSDYIAITGTRGKTTVATWIAHFLDKSVLGGNIPNKGLVKIIKFKAKLFVLELSSFQLEFMREGLPAPKIAVITNLYNDHLNRYSTFKNYIDQKAKIFLNQTKNDFLVLNAENKYTKEFLRKRPKSKIYYFSLKKIPKNKNGLFIIGSKIYFQESGHLSVIANKREILNLADHQKANLSVALLASRLYGQKWDNLLSKINTLPSVPFRQEIVFRKGDIDIINDTVATNPDATIAALERFSRRKKPLILIAGGTDKNLEFRDLADRIKRYLKKGNLFLLRGSATNKLIKELKRVNYFIKEEGQVLNSLKEILSVITEQKIKSGTILFSPGAASFEKFKNEFDRGKKFNYLVKNFFKK